MNEAAKSKQSKQSKVFKELEQLSKKGILKVKNLDSLRFRKGEWLLKFVNALKKANKELDINIKTIEEGEEIELEKEWKLIFKKNNDEIKIFMSFIHNEFEVKYKRKLKENNNNLDESALKKINDYLNSKEDLKSKFEELEPNKGFKISYKDTKNVSLDFYKDEKNKIKVNIIGDFLGEGGFGKVKTVFMGDVCEENGKYVVKDVIKKVRKVMKKKSSDSKIKEMENEKDRLKKEFQELEKIRGQDNAQMYSYNDDRLVIIDNFYPSMTFKDIKEKANIFQILNSMVSRIQRLGEIGIIHNDLKLDNMRIWYGEEKKKVKSKIIDFGLAQENGELKRVCGTSFTIAPETSDEGYNKGYKISEIDKERDVYALGVIFLTILCGYESEESLIKDLVKDLVKDLEKDLEKEKLKEEWDAKYIQNIIQGQIGKLVNNPGSSILYEKLLMTFKQDHDLVKKSIKMLKGMLEQDNFIRSDIYKVSKDIQSLEGRNKKRCISVASCVGIGVGVSAVILNLVGIPLLILTPLGAVIAGICLFVIIVNEFHFKDKIDRINSKDSNEKLSDNNKKTLINDGKKLSQLQLLQADTKNGNIKL